jgi:hypothetical protein
MLLDGINIQTLEFNNRFNMPLKCVKLPEPIHDREILLVSWLMTENFKTESI